MWYKYKWEKNSIQVTIYKNKPLHGALVHTLGKAAKPYTITLLVHMKAHLHPE